MILERLASPQSMEELEPTLSASLDSHRQQEREEREQVARGEYLERIIKLSGLFAKHLIFREHHVLDHLATRNLFIRLSANQEALEELVEYLTTPGKDSLGLGPVVLCSEPRSSSDPRHPFSLEQLLTRKLGADDRGYSAWEMSSVFDLSTLVSANREIQEAVASARLAKAYKHLGPGETYQRYLDIASRVWDTHAGVTRIPWGRGDFAARLQKNLSEASVEMDDEAASTARSLLSMIREEKIWLPGKREKPLARSAVNPWLRNQPRGYEMQRLVNWADFEAFVLSFPGRRGWVSSDDPNMLGVWKGAESNAEVVVKRELGDAITQVATIDTGGPIVLDELTFKDLGVLRNSSAFQQSLDRVREEWHFCHSRDELQRAIRDHVDLIYKELHLKDRSSRKREEGPSATVEIGLAVGGSLATALHMLGSVSFLAVPIMVTIKRLWTWRRHKTTGKRQLRELARQVTEAAGNRSAGGGGRIRCPSGDG